MVYTFTFCYLAPLTYYTKHLSVQGRRTSRFSVFDFSRYNFIMKTYLMLIVAVKVFLLISKFIHSRIFNSTMQYSSIFQLYKFLKRIYIPCILNWQIIASIQLLICGLTFFIRTRAIRNLVNIKFVCHFLELPYISIASFQSGNNKLKFLLYRKNTWSKESQSYVANYSQFHSERHR